MLKTQFPVELKKSESLENLLPKVLVFDVLVTILVYCTVA